MDAIGQLDWGVYSHFDFNPDPGVVQFMQWGDAISGYVGVGVLLAVAVLLFLAQGKRRSALVALVSFAVSVGMIQTVKYLVPRRRPENAEKWLGPQDMTGSYPSSSVFLFMLMIIFIGFAVWNGTKHPWQRALYALIATALTVWVCMSQFFLALHFLTDVLGAIAGAAFISCVAWWFLEPTADTNR